MYPDQVQNKLSLLRQTFGTGRTSVYSWRCSQLQSLLRFLGENEGVLAEAVSGDFGKSHAETFLTETAFVRGEIRHSLSRLRKWMKPERVSLPPHYQFGRAGVQYRPLGVVLVIGAWNYPLNTCLTPLVSAIAAGNCVVLKPSEQAPRTSRIIAERLSLYLDESAFAAFQGGVQETRSLLEERFDCIFFTGSRTAGREVMLSAARHMTPVILELGGKSPCIVEKDANMGIAARRIVWAKFLNAGQTCIAPDYLLVHRDARQELVMRLKEAIEKFYGRNPRECRDYPRIVSHRHFDRLENLMRNGEPLAGGPADRGVRYIPPTILGGVTIDDPIMKEEIFGPVLPVLTYETIDEALAIMRRNPDPLAVYLFTSSSSTARKVLEETRSGGFCRNDLLFQSAIHGLPFGGIGQSGFGRYHGRAGFEAFSYRRSILHRSLFPDPGLRYPPYGKLKFGFLRKILQFFD
jgi:acyl-CoA reductase-like NAD-dependent aldehyde dehydrogenase